MLDLHQQSTVTGKAGILPYMTEPDSSLARNSGGRDPLGLQPVWSDFGRKLVPNIASPVYRVDGIKAVLLIHWLADTKPVRTLLAKPDAERGFFRLMEGLVEYWLHINERPVCFGSQSLAAERERFAVTVDTGKTVANGLQQYYRGTCRRAKLLEHDWRVSDDLGAGFAKIWGSDALGALSDAIGRGLAGAPLIPAVVLDFGSVNLAFKQVFDSDELNTRLRAQLFGGDIYRELARKFSQLRVEGGSKFFGEDLAQLEYAPLANDLVHMRRCEPFLLVLQDVFDLLLAVPGRPVLKLVAELEPYFEIMRERASEFFSLAEHMSTMRMRQMQTLAEALIGETGASARTRLLSFIKRLVEHHATCMRERGREPMAMIEGGTLVLLVAGERDAQEAKKRLNSGYPWMNDYYLSTAANLYEQLHGEAA